MANVGKMIKAIRKQRGWSQTQLAAKVGLSKQTISNYEQQKREPDYVTLEAIADILNVPIGMLITGKEQEEALARIQSEYSVPATSKKEEDDLLSLRESLRRNPELQILFDASKNATAEDLLEAAELIKARKTIRSITERK